MPARYTLPVNAPWLVLVAMVSLCACSRGPTPRSVQASPRAGDDATERFAAAERLYRRGLWQEAKLAFAAVRTEFPYSKEATRSELREADALFAEQRFIESAEAYRSFVRYHATHPEAGYARAELAESLVAQVPEEWWFMSPVAERDQHILRQSIEACDEVLAHGPTERQAARAEHNRAACQTHLARHELYVAQFYARRGAHRGALARAEALLAAPQPPPVARAALVLGATSAKRLGDEDAAGRYWRLLQEQHPGSREAERARKELGKTAPAAGKEARNR